MTRQPVTVDEEKSVDYALSQMRRIGVRRLPVLGTSGELVGIVSLDDIIDALAKELTGVWGSIHSELRMEGALRQ